MLIVGLLLLAAAVLVGVAGVAANTGGEHQLAGGFTVFGYHLHSSAGKLFLAGLLIGAVGMLGFLMATEGLRRNAALRRELFRFRRQARAQERAQAAAPARRERVFARTAPAPSGDATDPGTSVSKATDTAAGTPAADSAGDSGWRRSVRNWRTARPTS
jgi:hypothetical protein